MNLLLSSLPLLLCGGAILALRTGWRKPAFRYRLLMPLAGLLLLAAIKLWARRVGIEFAVIYVLLSLTLTACLVIACRLEFRTVKATAPRLPERFSDTALTHKLATFVVAGPLTLLTACLVTIALAGLLPIARHEQLIVAALVYPFLIAFIIYWVCSSAKLARNSVFLLSICGASGAYLFL